MELQIAFTPFRRPSVSPIHLLDPILHTYIGHAHSEAFLETISSPFVSHRSTFTDNTFRLFVHPTVRRPLPAAIRRISSVLSSMPWSPYGFAPLALVSTAFIQVWHRTEAAWRCVARALFPPSCRSLPRCSCRSCPPCRPTLSLTNSPSHGCRNHLFQRHVVTKRYQTRSNLFTYKLLCQLLKNTRK